MAQSTTLVLGTGARLVREVSVHVLGPGGSRHGPLRAPIRIGKAEGNHVVLSSDPAISRFHCAIEARPKGLVLVDQASSNGTWVGEHRVVEIFLGERTEVRIGETQLVVEAADEGRLEALPVATDYGSLQAASAEMRRLFDRLGKLADSKAPVLLEGETGTGKDLAARALHQNSPLARGPFVIVDCGAASATLIEAELFGHEKHAFTGAEVAREGALAAADGGTLFLDELGELPLDLQPKLLRALESGQFKPLGANQHRSSSFRVISATHRDLRQMVNEGRFREDLFYRVAVVPLRIPPLRERTEDVAVLLQGFLEEELGSDAGDFQPSRETLAWFERQRWAGNVRELKNTVARAVALAEDDELARGELLPALRRAQQDAAAAEGMEQARRSFEVAYLSDLMARHDRDLAAAAQEAQIHPKSLQRLLRRHGMKRSR